MLGFIPSHLCQVLDESGGRNPETRLRAPPGVQTATCASRMPPPGEGQSSQTGSVLRCCFSGPGQVQHWTLSLVDQDHPGDFLAVRSPIKPGSFYDKNIERHCPPPNWESSVPPLPPPHTHIPAESSWRDFVAVCVSPCWVEGG